MIYFIWKGKKLKNMGDIMTAALALKDKAEGAAFMDTYREICEYADQNIGYMTGYYSNEQAAKILELTDTSHPVFGKHQFRPEQAFEIGLRRGQESR